MQSLSLTFGLAMCGPEFTKENQMNDFNKPPGQVANDAQQMGQDAVTKAKAVASDAMKVGSDAVDTGRAYAKDAVNAAGQKIDGVKSQLTQTTDSLVKAINDEPVKAVLIASVASSVLTALLILAMRSDDRYY